MKIKFFAIAALAATALFASCNRSEKLNPDEPGKPTSMKVSITFPNGPQTRATVDPNAVPEEAEIKTVDIFIYYFASNNFASHTRLTAADFTQTGTGLGGVTDAYVYSSANKIPTTTGDKVVFAGINLPNSVVDAIKYKPGATLHQVAQTMSREDLTGANGFAMFNVNTERRIFVEDPEDPENHVTLRCKRLVAKVTVERSATVDIAGAPGVLGTLQFAIFNFNTKLFMMIPTYIDPNWSDSEYNPADFNNPPDHNNPLTGGFVNVLDRAVIGSPTIGQYNPRYAAENSSELKRKKEITRAVVRATFVPRDITVGTTGNFNVVTNPNPTTVQTFYAVTPSVTLGTSYFTTQSIAAAFATEKGGTVIEYTNGYCYWDIFLNKNPADVTNRWDVLRNDFYKCNITRIVAPGRHTPDVPDPENTPDVDTSITADIEIFFWHTPILSNYILE